MLGHTGIAPLEFHHFIHCSSMFLTGCITSRVWKGIVALTAATQQIPLNAWVTSMDSHWPMEQAEQYLHRVCSQ